MPMSMTNLEAFDSRAAFESYVLTHAASFYATAFRGRGVYDRIETPSLVSARIAAQTLYEDRPVAIYATLGDRQIHIENYAPYALIYPSDYKKR